MFGRVPVQIARTAVQIARYSTVFFGVISRDRDPGAPIPGALWGFRVRTVQTVRWRDVDLPDDGAGESSKPPSP